MRTHQEIDARSLAMHRLVAAKIRRDPSLFEKARANLARWRVTACPSTLPYFVEWQRLMDVGMEVCLQFATEDSERATAMRQASPFAGILTNEERLAFLREWDPEGILAADAGLAQRIQALADGVEVDLATPLAAKDA